ncbi:holo-ACP synthase [Streptomyces amakusaensis]|uniref:Holo-[acyl-carrier-protein] synthase n=1 Tax=Streptomyces amakusaensis TaxID=67271 RepID=A0ABW0AMK1_9ACTN
MGSGRVGVDLVPFARVREMLARDDGLLMARMLTEAERALCSPGRSPDIAGIAGRLAAKEAVFKLFHSSRETLPWQGIEVLKGPGGWPEVRLSGRAAELAEAALIGRIEISIAHDEPCAIAVACAARP